MVIDMGLAIIITGLSMNIMMILILLMNNRNWFARENFKIQKSNIMAENKIKLKKLEKELGVTHTPVANEPTGNILDQLKNLDMDKIQGLLDMLGAGSDVEDDKSPVDKIIQMATENPEIVSKFLGGLKGQNTGKTGDTYL